jgi:MFS family permease
MIFSCLLAIGAFALMGFTLTPESTQLEVSWKMVLIGLGMGPTIPLFTIAIQNAVPPQQIGVATSMATFSRSMGVTIGLAILGTAFASQLASGMQHRVGPEIAFTDAIELVYRICMGIGVLGLLVVLAIPEKPMRRGAGGPPPPAE